MGLSQYSSISSLSTEEINVEMVKIEKEIFDLRFKKATRQSYKLHELKNKKRKLAQLKTFARTLLDQENK
jgi:large subunit ribosomal protein L29